MEYEPILPLRAIAFQVMFLMVAISIEAGVLRQRLRLGFKTSVQCVTLINLAAVVAGWIVFLVVEPLSSPEIKAQIISYVLFDRLLVNGWTAESGGILFMIGLGAFFATFFIKAKGLELILRANGAWKIPDKPERLSREQRYGHARQGRNDSQQAIADFIDAVIQANAASFTAIVVLLVLRAMAEKWV
ncbi:MAG: filament integrity protein FraC [Phormidesmis sp.]